MSVLKDIRDDLEKGAVRLVAEYRDRLFAEAVRLCSDHSVAEDLVSRTFIKVLANIDRQAEYGNLFAWMKKVMLNIHLDDLKRPVARGTQPVEAAALEEYAGADNRTDEEILLNSDKDALRIALDRLDPEYRQVVSMYYFSELSLKEIACLLHSSTSSVSRRLQIARRILAAKIGVTPVRKAVVVAALALSLFGAAFASWTTGFFGLMPESTPAESTETARQAPNTNTFNTVTDNPNEDNQMKTNKLAAIAAAAMLSTTAVAEYADDYVSIDSGAVTAIDLGNDICYVFSNAVSGVKLTTQRQMMLRAYLVVGGGGGGAGQIGGGGGGGGVTSASGVNQPISADTVFTITVGAGAAQNKSVGAQAYNGGHSSLVWGDTTFWGYGGGGGGAWSGNSAVGVSTPALAAVENEIGSGGGASYNASVGQKGENWFQGNAGGNGNNVWNGGGGGGASEAGNTRGAGCGGEGVTCDITGTPQVYGSGGGGGPQGTTRYPGGTNAGQGGCSNPGLEGEPGVDGFGGGGGGGAYVTTTCGGAGGCGTVILRFAKKDVTQYVFHLEPIAGQWYSGMAVCPEVVARYDADGATVDPASYDIVWKNNIGPGTARVTAVGKDEHDGVSASMDFVIKECYSDDNLLSDDTSVRMVRQGDRFVYVFTNCERQTVLHFKRTMTLVEGLVVGGGGAGGTPISGGGGGGGVVAFTDEHIIPEGAEPVITVGAGGKPSNKDVWTIPGGEGGDSSFDHAGYTVTAYGGAGGCGFSQVSLADGKFGSGGGGKGTGSYIDGLHYTASQGHAGAGGEGGGGQSAPGGGGGAGEPGHASANGVAGNGGEGVTNSITGVAEVYGSGGGGGAGNGIATPGRGGTHAGSGSAKDSGLAAGSGDPGFGGGGGGGSYMPQTDAGAGGSGTVMLAFVAGGSVAQPTIGNVEVDFVNGTTQPRARVTLGCETPGGKYSATVRVQFGTAEGVWDCEGTAMNIANGGTAEILAPFSPATGSTLWLRVTVSCEGAESIVETVDRPTEGVQSPCVGKGGGAGVIHVRPGATGRGDGSDWFNALTDFRAAIERIDETHSEVWLSGDELMDYSLVKAINPTIPATIRGGFDGTECAPAERAANSRSTIDGNSKYACFTLQNAKALTLDGFRLWGRNKNAIAKTAAGDLTVTNCTIENCSVVGVSVSGTAASTVARFSATRFADLTAGTSGSALNVSSLKRVYLDGCEIVRCGVSLGNGFGDVTGHLDKGHALYFNGVPVTMSGCVVKGCRAASIEKLVPGSGGVIRLNGACGGSVIANCAFVANESVHAYPNHDGNFLGDGSSGVLTVDMSSTADAIDLENCTFAYNVAGGIDLPADLNVIVGTVNVRNSVFSGAKVLREVNDAARDIMVRAAGVANISYSMFDVEGPECVGGDEGAQINLGQGLVYGDPMLVSTVEEFADYLIFGSGSFIGFDSAKAEALCDWVNVHVHSKMGYVDEKTGETVKSAGGVRFTSYSPAIDAGDSASGYALEPKPNGKRVNLGFYGNTPWASMSRRSGFCIIVR